MDRRRALLTASAVALVGGAAAAHWWMKPDGSSQPGPIPSAKSASPTLAATSDAGPPPTYTCPHGAGLSPVFSASIPGNAAIQNQDGADCFAWWEFISLNWPTSGQSFGDPDDLEPVQWQTWIEDRDLFPPNGAAPGERKGAGGAIASAACLAEAGLDVAKAGGKMQLIRAASKFHTGNAEIFGPDQFEEAAPRNAPNWLASQNGHNVWYEVRVSPDEENFVVQNQFYNANAQWSYVTGDGGVTLNDAGQVVGDGGHAFNLPQGTSASAGTPGTVGAIETKAAWMEVDDPTNPKWKTYKRMRSIVVDPTTGKCRATTLALVGLHIIHKTASQRSWVWATFEHVMNVPGSTLPSGGVEPDGGFNFYDPSCEAKEAAGERTVSVLPSCIPDGGTGTTPVPVNLGCTANQAPPYYMGPGCNPAPIQVTRVNPIDSTASRQTRAAWSAIQQNYAGSVWMNYQLVNVIWSTSSGQPSGPVPAPLALNAMLPPAVVANTTLETYEQTKTCTGCHVLATIAPTAADCDPKWNSDVSFLMGQASVPGGSPCDPKAIRARKRIRKSR